ncbi:MULTISPECIES: AfsR/SARP family transcriptional regulator [unclassified Streptomyces]|uniref:AfsR/SARP family transcriptional regulator n=2 Tax=unclassified Streptomyces TaxID=2593676 RepID=UPI0022566A90|nr:MULTISPECIES: AfsR/SARP family transcriptional regulator [unclassified Streptomyces]MCX5142763.1 AfsR/SARP family transcriptional regulator [Streptomyces sp. NBC_00338]WRZ67198.1 AfsR/SARP family transcriptional regulator [Streptomyces sp. NBC_01257]WSU61211.1 AfsR/SARP family transcriptional regulator [Streptomyces sp. NBC_01104]
MDVFVLGSFDVRISGARITPTALKPAKLLALLSMSRGQHVSLAECVQELWAGDAPRTAGAAIHTYVRKLRELIATAIPGVDPKTVICTRPGGYLLNLAPGGIDLEEFVRLAERGHRAAALGDDALAAGRFRQSLALWRGPVLADLPAGPILAIRKKELEEYRKTALDRCISAELRMGRHYELLGELVALAADDRTHEPLHAQLMLALYRAGRRVQALEVYRELRHELSSRLGLEPSPRIQALHRAILASDCSLQRETGERTPSRTA